MKRILWETRKKNKRAADESAQRGRGTEKDAILGAVQRGGKVVAHLATELAGCAILDFIKKHVKMTGSELITDEFKAYQRVGREMKHAVIHHKVRFVDGDRHTNTIEGFWSLLKRAWWTNITITNRIHVPVRCRGVL